MTDEKTISHQAKRILELEAIVADALEALDLIRLTLICVGGPLNDNKLGYSTRQQAPLQRILMLAENTCVTYSQNYATQQRVSRSRCAGG